MSNIKDTAKAYFKAYPNADKFFVTSDGQFFPEENKSMALSHQRSVKKEGKLQEVEREAKEVEVVEIPDGDPSDTWTAKQLRAYAEQNEIEVEGSKKADYLQAIEEAKASE